jgi:hypothetical protein
MGLARETGNMIGAAVVPLVAVQLSYLGSGTLPLSLLLGISILGLLGVAATPRPEVHPRETPGGRRMTRTTDHRTALEVRPTGTTGRRIEI